MPDLRVEALRERPAITDEDRRWLRSVGITREEERR